MLVGFCTRKDGSNQCEIQLYENDLKQEKSLPREDLRPLSLGEEAAPHPVAGPTPPLHSTQEPACCSERMREKEKVKKQRKFPACCKRERERERKNTTYLLQ
jgi:hypothetical protein